MSKDQLINIISTGISIGFNHPKTKVKGISLCYGCKSNNLDYNQDIDEISCKSCGLVLRQGLADFTPLECAVFPVMSRENKNRKLRRE